VRGKGAKATGTGSQPADNVYTWWVWVWGLEGEEGREGKNPEGMAVNRQTVSTPGGVWVGGGGGLLTGNQLADRQCLHQRGDLLVME